VVTQVLLPTFLARQTHLVWCVNYDKSRKYRHDENLIKRENSGRTFVLSRPGTREKGKEINEVYSYPEPALVPLGE
jgi:hypothetical protein